MDFKVDILRIHFQYLIWLQPLLVTSWEERFCYLSVSKHYTFLFLEFFSKYLSKHLLAFFSHISHSIDFFSGYVRKNWASILQILIAWQQSKDDMMVKTITFNILRAFFLKICESQNHKLNAKTQSHCHEGKFQHKWPPVDILSHTNKQSTVKFHFYQENCLTTVSMNGSKLTLSLLALKHTHIHTQNQSITKTTFNL